MTPAVTISLEFRASETCGSIRKPAIPTTTKASMALRHVVGAYPPSATPSATIGMAATATGVDLLTMEVHSRTERVPTAASRDIEPRRASR